VNAGKENPNMKQLDVTATVSEAYKGAWSHFGDMVKLVWAPVTIYLAASILHSNYLQAKLEGVNPEDTEAVAAAIWSWPTVVMMLVTLFLWPMIAVAWHRFILLGESSNSALYFRFGQREARFLLVTIFLSLLVVPGILVVAAGGATALATVTLPVGLVLMVAGLVYGLRLSLLLPAVATDGQIDAKGILDATQGNVGQIVATHLLNLGALFCIAIGVSIVGGIAALLIGSFGSVLAGAVVTVFSQIISVAILSVMYRQLVIEASPAPGQNNDLH
jgi:hypothetical protein